ncbi:MAG: putative protein yqfU [Alphaproteobacteria bacterium]|nr:putative protein yqfU [Alphaproteobacteria bacterium]
MAKRKFYAAANRFTLRDFFFICAGIAAACIGLKGFLLPSHFLDGGVTGISLIVQRLTNLNFAALLLVFNVPFIFLGRSSVSNLFALKSSVAIALFALVLWLVPVPVMTRDPVLIAVFGGFFAGCGIGLAIRGGAVLDGTEVLALYLAKRSSLTVGEYIMGINIIIFTVAIIAFDIETALYAVLTYFCASKTVDFVVYGVEEYMAVQIFSERSAALHKVLKTELKVSIKILHGQRGAPGAAAERVSQISILQIVVSRLDLTRLLNTVQALDPEATIMYHPVTDIHRASAVHTLSLADQVKQT